MGYLSELKLPLLGETMQSGRIAEWCVKPGAHYSRGQVLLEVETDKTMVEVPALQQGKLIEILAGIDSVVSVGESIARIELEGDHPPDPRLDAPAISLIVTPLKSTGAVSAQSQEVKSKDKSAAGPSRHDAPRRFVTPRARLTAEQLGVDLSMVQGTGRRGRVTAQDVITTVPAKPHGSSRFDRRSENIDTPFGALYRTQWIPQQSLSKTTLVLLHGLFGDSQLWHEIASALASSGYRVCTLDLPAHGGSQCSAGTLVDISRCVAQALDGFESLLLVGHSYGGAVAIKVAALLPVVTKTLFLLAPVGLGNDIDQHFLDTMADPASNDSQLGTALSRLSATGEIPEAHFIRALSMRLQRNVQHRQAMVNEIASSGKQSVSLYAELEAIIAPVNILWGRQDRIVSWRHILQTPENVTLQILPDSGHMPQLEQPEKVVGLLLTAI